ncbi:MAG: 6-carboxyhexanoate--CoA ligase [Nitrospirae bacterium]|nr:6-carboxyhexanoate--CoA ligase [Nitrospirota bacterium]
MRASRGDLHVSGAEGLYREGDLEDRAAAYLRRALSHDRGTPDSVVITVERLEEEPLRIGLQPVHSVGTSDYAEAWGFIRGVLSSLGVSGEAFDTARSVVESRDVMRGAALVRILSGARAEPDRARGVRVSRLGIDTALLQRLKECLRRCGVDVTVVSEALVLASKVASSPHVVAELCVSDDPGYTTGYLSSRKTGYVRVPHVKQRGAMSGGRVFFVTEEGGVEDTVRYLEETPVMVDRLSDVHDTVSPDEFIRSIDR